MKKFLLIIFVAVFCACNFAYADDYVQPTVSTEAKFYYNQGVDYYKNGQYDLSMDAFRNAIAADPNYIDAYYNLGSILEFLKQDDAALSVFKQIIVRKPDDYDSVYKAANISKRLGYTQNAKDYLALIPSNAIAYKKASILAASMGTDMQTIKSASQKKVAQSGVTQTSVTQSNGIIKNIISPTGLVTDNAGNLYVACFSDSTIYKITPEGKRVLLVKDSRLSGPIGIDRDSSGNLYIANYNKNDIIKYSSSGVVSILLANVSKPYMVHVAGNILYISSQGSNSVIKYKLY